MKGSIGIEGIVGPTGFTGGPGPTGPPMSEWMPPVQYAVMLKFMAGEINLEQLRVKARQFLKEMEQ